MYLDETCRNPAVAVGELVTCVHNILLGSRGELPWFSHACECLKASTVGTWDLNLAPQLWTLLSTSRLDRFTFLCFHSVSFYMHFSPPTTHSPDPREHQEGSHFEIHPIISPLLMITSPWLLTPRLQAGNAFPSGFSFIRLFAARSLLTGPTHSLHLWRPSSMWLSVCTLGLFSLLGLFLTATYQLKSTGTMLASSLCYKY